MSTIIKLIFTALIMNACVQAGRSSWGFYDFQDSVQQAVLFSTTQTAEQLKGRITKVALEKNINLAPESVSVRYLSTQALVKASYTDDVALLPGYVYKWTHELDLDMRRMAY